MLCILIINCNFEQGWYTFLNIQCKAKHFCLAEEMYRLAWFEFADFCILINTWMAKIGSCQMDFL